MNPTSVTCPLAPALPTPHPPHVQSEISQLEGQLATATREREAAERKAAEAATALEAARQLHAVQEALQRREEEVADLQHERCELEAQVGRRHGVGSAAVVV